MTEQETRYRLDFQTADGKWVVDTNMVLLSKHTGFYDFKPSVHPAFHGCLSQEEVMALVKLLNSIKDKMQLDGRLTTADLERIKNNGANPGSVNDPRVLLQNCNGVESVEVNWTVNVLSCENATEVLWALAQYPNKGLNCEPAGDSTFRISFKELPKMEPKINNPEGSLPMSFSMIRMR